MEQVYTPLIDTKAFPAMCLQYVDDAGNAPQRSTTAKAAYDKEKKAKRISLSELPDKIWVVVWFSFSKGSYTYPNGDTIYYKDAWHIAFARRNGKNIEIHDSEVHSGSRQPYVAFEAVEAWFGAYDAKYVGWSTHCDGREYAKLKENNMIKNTNHVKILFRQFLNREPTAAELKDYASKDIEYFLNKAYKVRTDLRATIKERDALKQQLAEKPVTINKTVVIDYLNKNLK